MAPPKVYHPADQFPNLTGGTVAGVPSILLQEDGDELLWYETWRNDYTIVSASNTTPVKITTSEAITGQIVTGNSVLVQGVSGSSTANALWLSVTVVDDHSFTLDGSTAGGAGTGGRAYEVTLGLFSKLIDACNYLGVRLLGTAYTTGLVSMQGRKVWNRPRVQLTGADHTISVTDGDVFELAPTPAASHVITLSQTSPVPEEGETLTFVCPGLLNTYTYSFQRTGPTLIATFYGTALQNTSPFAVFEFVSGVWRLRDNSGWVQGETQGVLTGPGA